MTTEKAPSKQAMEAAEKCYDGMGLSSTADDKAAIAAALESFAAEEVERTLANDKAVQNIAAGYAAQLKAAADYADALRERNRALVEALREVTLPCHDYDSDQCECPCHRGVRPWW